MNTNSHTAAALAAKIAEMESKLAALEQEIAEIGPPASYELQKRFDALRIEERALKRNFKESTARGEADSVRLWKVEALLRHMEREEASVEHEAHFLHQAAPSSVVLAAEAAARLIELYRRSIKQVLGDLRPFGESVFVNHTHEALAAEYGLDRTPVGAAGVADRERF